ncbi:MAG: DoxX family protein [Bacteroidetes bacterium]|nr:DoxX family protein [Bacteroidota bacterium]
MKDLLFATSTGWAPLLLRITLGAVMFPHGAQKLLGWWGGSGFKASLDYFTGTIGLPAIAGVLIILAESVGALALIAGLGTRIWAAAFLVIMVGAIITVHGSNGFFMNWFGAQAGEGIEFNLLMIGMALALLVAGGGRFAVDGTLA